MSRKNDEKTPGAEEVKETASGSKPSPDMAPEPEAPPLVGDDTPLPLPVDPAIVAAVVDEVKGVMADVVKEALAAPVSAPAPEGAVGPDPQEPANARNHALIRIAENAPGSVEPEIVTVSVNGKRLAIRRNEIVPVHESFVENLRHAVQPMVEKGNEEDIAIRRRKVTRHAPRFGVELIRKITASEAIYFKQILKERGTISEQEAYGE